jgi:hypothetical protein
MFDSVACRDELLKFGSEHGNDFSDRMLDDIELDRRVDWS